MPLTLASRFAHVLCLPLSHLGAVVLREAGVASRRELGGSECDRCDRGNVLPASRDTSALSATQRPYLDHPIVIRRFKRLRGGGGRAGGRGCVCERLSLRGELFVSQVCSSEVSGDNSLPSILVFVM